MPTPSDPPVAERKAATFGPEPAIEVAGQWWCWWDVWFAVIAVTDHHSDLTLMRDAYAARIGALHDGRTAEARWAHVVDLLERLDASDVTVADIAEPFLTDKRLLVRARDKTTNASLEHRAMTPAMLRPPRVVLQEHAWYGTWHRFPVSPAVFYNQLRPAAGGFVPKHQSFTATQRITARIRRADQPRLDPAERVALYRASHIAMIDLQSTADDSFGAIGQARVGLWETYLSLRPEPAGIDPSLWWTDLCGLLVWDDYALTHGTETFHWQHLDPVLAGHVEQVLDDLATEHASVHLSDRVDAANTEAAWLAITLQRTHRYVDLATRLGPGGWIPVQAMARHALSCGDRTLARAVFDAADREHVLRSNLHAAATRTFAT